MPPIDIDDDVAEAALAALVMVIDIVEEPMFMPLISAILELILSFCWSCSGRS